MEFHSCQVQSCHLWPTHLLQTFRHDFPNSQMEVRAQTRTLPLCSQILRLRHHLRRPHLFPPHTSPRPLRWHILNTFRQIPVPGMPYPSRSTGWQTAFNNFSNMLRCRSFRSARLFPAMDPSNSSLYLYKYCTLFSFKSHDGMRLRRSTMIRYHTLPFSAVTHRTGVSRIGVHGKGRNPFDFLKRLWTVSKKFIVIIFIVCSCTECGCALAEKAV